LTNSGEFVDKTGMADFQTRFLRTEAFCFVLASAVVVVGLAVLVCGCATISKVEESRREKIISAAGDTLGLKYSYGKQGPDVGFDCSGLAQYVYGKAGISIPRTTKDQYARSKRVSRYALRQGDLVFFTTEGSSITHVGIYIGGDKFIHAPSTGGEVRISSLSEPYWRETFYSGGRYLR
jgi:cell wall-associated NlpC family hydrolase